MPPPAEQLPIEITIPVNPLYPPLHLLQLDIIKPEEYYVTSGEALQKTQYLIIQIQNQWNKIKKIEPSPELNNYAIDVQLALHQARQFLQQLIILKGNHTWLECCKEDGRVIAIPKLSRNEKNSRSAGRNAKITAPPPTCGLCGGPLWKISPDHPTIHTKCYNKRRDREKEQEKARRIPTARSSRP